MPSPELKTKDKKENYFNNKELKEFDPSNYKKVFRRDRRIKLKVKYIIGFLFICIGVLANKLVLEYFVSPYAIAELNRRIPIILINISLIMSGLFFIVLKKEYFSSRRIFNVYKFIAMIFLTGFLFFIFINVVIYGYEMIKDISFYKNQIFFTYHKTFKEIYPTLKGKEVNSLLYETWLRPYVYEPYTGFKERPFKGKYINVHEAGFRYTKNQGVWPPDPKNVNIFLFGGSNVFNYAVPDDETIASHLQDLFWKNVKSHNKESKVYVYNFGRGNYFSSQEKILFQELLTSGFIPNLAVFIDGFSDFYYFDNEPLFTKRLQKFIDSESNLSFIKLPFINIIKEIKKVADVQLDKSDGLYDNEGLLKKVIRRYVTNKKLIEATGAAFNVNTLFVWQPIPTYKYDLKYHIFSGKGFGRFLYSKYGYAYMEKFNKENNLGSNFLYLADMQENIKKPLYVDIDHYSSYMSEIIAERIYKFLIKNALV